MRNYIILNNKKSDTISGLIIQELPPISKPAQRTQIETIDGRDGDIVTPLGYAAYDKTFTIGLYGTFDINEIIAYFATEGQVIFSNEPNKYYNYQIVDQIDYERLVRYKVATVTMHVQPFKYSSTESPIIVDSSDTVSDEGSDIALDGTAEAPFNVLRHKGNATQKTLSGKNQLPPVADFSTTVATVSIKSENGVWTFNGTATANSNTGVRSSIAGYTIQSGDYWHYNNTFASAQINIQIKFTDNTSFATSMSVLNKIVSLEDYVGKTVAQEICNFNAGNTFNGTASPMILHNVSTVTDFEPYVGGIPSPNPDYPQDINVVTGDSTVVICGKNSLSAPQDYTEDRDGLVFSCLNGVYNIRGNASSGSQTADHDITQPYTIREGDYWHLCNDFTDTHIQIALVFTDGSSRNYSPNVVNRIESLSAYAGKTVSKIRFYYNSGYNINGNIKPMILNGVSAATDFIPYQGQSYVLPFGDTYLAKIGDYADEPVKVDGTWYIRRAIGKFIFNGTPMSGNIIKDGSQSNAESGIFYCGQLTDADGNTAQYGDKTISDHFIAANVYNVSHTENGYYIGQTNKTLAIRIRGDVIGASMTISDMTTWFSTHPTTFYYILATPTDEAITSQDLIDALDELFDQAHSYKGHTHITATPESGNAPAVLSVNVNEDNESTVTNAGNTTSRPILTIYGQGDIGVYINDVEVLDVALGDEEYITLDSVEMEAYKDSTANLKNRLVTGDYSKLALNAGANKIRFTGIVTKYEISKYSRWL